MLSLNELRRVVKQGGTLIFDVFNREQLLLKYQLGKSKRFFSRLRWAALPFLLKLHNRRMLFGFFKWRVYPSFFLLQKRVVSQNGIKLCDMWVVWDKVKGQSVVFEHAVRLYEFSELQALLEQTGFGVNQVYGGYEGENVNPSSSRLILVSNTK